MRRTGNRPRRRLGPVEAVCLNCAWRASGPSWRPVKRQLAEHKAKRHADMVGGKAEVPA